MAVAYGAIRSRSAVSAWVAHFEGSVLIARSRVLRDCRRAPIDDDDDVVPTDVREFRMEEWTNFDFDRRLLGDFTADDISDGLVLRVSAIRQAVPTRPFCCVREAHVYITAKPRPL